MSVFHSVPPVRVQKWNAGTAWVSVPITQAGFCRYNFNKSNKIPGLFLCVLWGCYVITINAVTPETIQNQSLYLQLSKNHFFNTYGCINTFL
ncbi:hypothetical protein SAMN05216524_102471 [Mucilaginibacter sp. OK098]|nr:hypothetical protein SAMN05216524_102471 [Mucilaginibacter sp. OK098]